MATLSDVWENTLVIFFRSTGISTCIDTSEHLKEILGGDFIPGYVSAGWVKIFKTTLRNANSFSSWWNETWSFLGLMPGNKVQFYVEVDRK